MHKGNITSGFEDNLALSNTFLDKYAKIEEQVTPVKPIPTETAIVASSTTKRVASKEELPGLGFTHEGTGIYKDSAHHLWELSRVGEGYSITRVAEEEAILTEKKVVASVRVASQVTVSSDSGLLTFFANLDQNGIYYNKVSEDTTGAGYSAVIDIDAEDMPDFTTIARDSGVKTGSKESAEGTDECKVFSDEAILTGISHYVTMGYATKEAVNNFIASNNLDKKYYEPLINEVLGRYNY